MSLGVTGLYWAVLGSTGLWWGWFDESSDDSWSICACINAIQIFLADGLTNGRTEVFHEALADLKWTLKPCRACMPAVLQSGRNGRESP